MPGKTHKAEVVGPKAGSAGVLASIVMAIAGVVLGAAGSYLGGQGTAARASRAYAVSLDLRDAKPAEGVTREGRARIVERVLSGGAPERLDPPPLLPGRPRIVIIFDDMGIDKDAFEQVMTLPGPLTLSFLPYASDLQPLVDRARARGDAVMLHLPMEPEGDEDPGPHSLSLEMTGSRLLKELDWNLSRFTGYVGVNNHMGSKFTTDLPTMKTVLSVLAEKGLFFLDSLTTPDSTARKAGEAVGETVFARDVFLDPEAGPEMVRAQIAQVEHIAKATGYAVAICHPRPDTIAVIGPWLTTAPTRGFELATVTTLYDIEKRWREEEEIRSRLQAKS